LPFPADGDVVNLVDCSSVRQSPGGLVDHLVREGGTSDDKVIGGAEFSEEFSSCAPVPYFPMMSSLSLLSVPTLALKCPMRSFRSLFGLLSRTA
jgi:hypothetical protein